MLESLRAFLSERLHGRPDHPSVLLPTGPRLRHSFIAAITALCFLELCTGLALMTVYAPSAQTAWASVAYIQQHFPIGRLLRAIHHHAADAVLVTAALHLLFMLVVGAYRRPRELNWWAALGLFAVIVLFAHSGSMLPWDQKAYWTARVEAGIAGTVPVFGTMAQRMIQGGRELGTLTLTRLYAIHVGLLPLVAILLLRAQRTLTRTHGFAGPTDARQEARWWPAQAARDGVVALLVVTAVSAFAASHAATLDAPADPNGEYPARPEWFFLGLYRLRKALEGGPKELLATVVIPGLVTGFFVLLPLIDRSPSRAFRKRLPVVVVGVALMGMIAGLTAAQMRADAHEPSFVRARAQADRQAARALVMAAAGVPPEGPLEMVRNDPTVRPGELFAQHCGNCHAGPEAPARDAAGHRTDARGPTLDGFASRAWARALLVNPDADPLFGRTEIHEMPPQAQRLGEDGMNAVVEYLYAQSVEPGDPAANAELARAGDAIYHQRCTGCHQGEGDQSGAEAEERDAPDLTGWGSRAWIRSQITHPAARTNYGERNQMPAFADTLSARELEWVIDAVRQLRNRPAPVVAAPPPRAAAPAEDAPEEPPAPAPARRTRRSRR